MKGKGIYTSILPNIPISYCLSLPKMFVCAVLVVRKCTIANATYSHFKGDENVTTEWNFRVVRKPEYVIPLYFVTFTGY